LTSEYVRTALGPAIMEPANEYRLSSWCVQQEDLHRIVIYQCDPSSTLWTRRCIRQADCILIVALADKEPAEGKVRAF
jgi:lysophospholipid hydrolase